MLCHLEYNCFSNMLHCFKGHYEQYFQSFTEINIQRKKKAVFSVFRKIQENFFKKLITCTVQFII